MVLKMRNLVIKYSKCLLIFYYVSIAMCTERAKGTGLHGPKYNVTHVFISDILSESKNFSSKVPLFGFSALGLNSFLEFKGLICSNLAEISFKSLKCNHRKPPDGWQSL